MTIHFQARPSDSPYLETVTHGYTASAGVTMRPSETHWHMVLRKLDGQTNLLVVGPLTSAAPLSYGAGAELLWIRFKLGVFMPCMPLREIADLETSLPGATSRSFWLNDSAWQFPTFEDVEEFVRCLARQGVLARDPLVDEALQDPPPGVASRTLRHRFQRATGLTRAHVRQAQRAGQAAALLEQGTPVLDVVYRLGYFDQPHLTRSLKRFTGKTPAQFSPGACLPV